MRAKLGRLALLSPCSEKIPETESPVIPFTVKIGRHNI